MQESPGKKPLQTSSNWVRFAKNNTLWDDRMNKRQIAVVFDGIIHEYLKAEKQFDTRNKLQIFKLRFTAILQKLKNKIQADSKLVKLCEFNVGLG